MLQSRPVMVGGSLLVASDWELDAYRTSQERRAASEKIYAHSADPLHEPLASAATPAMLAMASFKSTPLASGGTPNRTVNSNELSQPLPALPYSVAPPLSAGGVLPPATNGPYFSFASRY